MEEFIAFVASVMDVEPDELSADTAYKTFPAWDSLMMLNLIMETEDKYEIKIPLEEVGKIKTLQDLYNITQK